jgi:hypothetical protein
MFVRVTLSAERSRVGRRKLYASATERKQAQRQRQKLQASSTARLTHLQAEAALQHVGSCGRLDYWPAPSATAENRALQEELKERDMMDALWTLQTLIADFGYAAVYEHVLQHIMPPTP